MLGFIFSRRFISLAFLPAGLLVVGSIGLSFSIFKADLIEKELIDLREMARLASIQARSVFPLTDSSNLQELVRNWEGKSSFRFTVASPSGKALADSREDPSRLENQSHLPEFQKARSGGFAFSAVDSALEGDRMMSAVPIEAGGKIVGVVLVRAPANGIVDEWAGFADRFLIIATALVFILAYFLWRWNRLYDKSMNAVDNAVNQLSKGELNIHSVENLAVDAGRLLSNLNKMAELIDSRIRNAVLQKNEVEAVLFSMSEGVLAVSADERILRVNRAAENLFGIEGGNSLGRRFHEIFRNSKLKAFIRKALESSEPVEDQFTIMGEKDCFIHAHGAALMDAENKRIGVLAVLSDVTKLKELENMRRDFVANVSHELKTPITSIKGFVETLMQEDFNDPESSRRFLNIIMKQTRRLNVIIDDLLSLSRIESESDRFEISRERVNIKNLLQSAIQDCDFIAKENSVDVELACEEKLLANVNWPLLEEAVVNLIQNAMKYGKEGGKVKVSGSMENKDLLISVQDWGAGIEAIHLPRLFERFYRVDAARSRDLGGSGLGLAIVKHIAQAHNGSIHVESKPGHGTRFFISIRDSLTD